MKSASKSIHIGDLGKLNEIRSRARITLTLFAAIVSLFVTTFATLATTAPAMATSAPHDQLAIKPVPAAVAQLPASVRKQGVLVAAMTATSPPGSYFPANSRTLTGLDPDIAKLLAEALGLHLQMDLVGFNQIIPGIAAGRYAIAVAEMSPEPVREKVLNFVDYARTGDALAVPMGNPKHIDINNLCGLTVGALSGGYQITEVLPGINKQCLKLGKPAIQFKLYPDENSPILALASNRIDAVYEDSTVLDYAAKHDHNIEVQVNRNFSPIAVGIGKSTGMTKAVHTAMSAVLKSPQYRSALLNLGLSDVAVATARLNDNG